MTKRNSRPAVLHLRKLKGESGTNLPSLSKARLKELVEQAIVDAYGEEEQVGGFFTMIEEYLTRLRLRPTSHAFVGLRAPSTDRNTNMCKHVRDMDRSRR